MKLRNMVAPVVFGALSLAVANAHAAGTTAGTTITNQANLSYSVNGSNQTTNSTNNFAVDVKIDFNLETNNSVIYTDDLSGSSVEIASIKLGNTGNAAGNFEIKITDLAENSEHLLYGASAPNTTKDTYDLVSADYSVTEDTTGGSSGATISVDDSTSIITVSGLAVDTNISIDVTVAKAAFTGNGLNSSTVAIQEFEAKAVQVTLADNSTQAIGASDNNGTADTSDVQIVFADDGNGVLGDNSEKVLEAVQLDLPYFPEPTDPNAPETEKGLFKSSRVIWDPINGALNTTSGSAVYPKAIPGAVVEYTITLRNFGSVAGQMTISDTLDSDTELCQSADNSAQTTGGTCFDVVHDNKNGTAADQTREQISSDTTAPALTPATPVEAVITTPSGNISAVFATYPADQKAVIKYTVKIK